jgi:hypothetical protein
MGLDPGSVVPLDVESSTSDGSTNRADQFTQTREIVDTLCPGFTVFSIPATCIDHACVKRSSHRLITLDSAPRSTHVMLSWYADLCESRDEPQ